MNLLDLDPQGLERYFAERGDKPFRARQVSRWLHQRFADAPERMLIPPPPPIDTNTDPLGMDNLPDGFHWWDD